MFSPPGLTPLLYSKPQLQARRLQLKLDIMDNQDLPNVSPSYWYPAIPVLTFNPTMPRGTKSESNVEKEKPILNFPLRQWNFFILEFMETLFFQFFKIR